MAGDPRSLSNVPAPDPETVRNLLALLAPVQSPLDDRDDRVA